MNVKPHFSLHHAVVKTVSTPLKPEPHMIEQHVKTYTVLTYVLVMTISAQLKPEPHMIAQYVKTYTVLIFVLVMTVLAILKNMASYHVKSQLTLGREILANRTNKGGAY